MGTMTLTLPKALRETLNGLARRDGRSQADVVLTALEIYAERASAEPRVAGSEEAPLPSRNGIIDASENDPAHAADVRGRRFATLGVGESTIDDGYDSTNIEDWIRKTCNPDTAWSPE